MLTYLLFVSGITNAQHIALARIQGNANLEYHKAVKEFFEQLDNVFETDPRLSNCKVFADQVSMAEIEAKRKQKKPIYALASTRYVFSDTYDGGGSENICTLYIGVVVNNIMPYKMPFMVIHFSSSRDLKTQLQRNTNKFKELALYGLKPATLPVADIDAATSSKIKQPLLDLLTNDNDLAYYVKPKISDKNTICDVNIEHCINGERNNTEGTVSLFLGCPSNSQALFEIKPYPSGNVKEKDLNEFISAIKENLLR